MNNETMARAVMKEYRTVMLQSCSCSLQRKLP